MSETDFLKLKKHDNVETNTEKFDIENYLNGNWDKINENAKKVNTDISNINLKNKEQDTNIEQLQENTEISSNKIAELEKELKEAQEDFYQNSIRGQASGEYIHVEDSSNCRARIGIGGNSEQKMRSGKNYLNTLAKYKAGEKVTVDGITYIFNEDGSITCNGTATADSVLTFSSNLQTINGSGKKIVGMITGTQVPAKLSILAYTSDWSKNTFTILSNVNKNITTNMQENIDYTIFRIIVCKGTTLNNQTIYYQILDTSVNDLTYEQYGASPSPDYLSKIETVGSNVNIFDKDNMTIGKIWSGATLLDSDVGNASPKIPVTAGKTYIRNAGYSSNYIIKENNSVVDVQGGTNAITMPEDAKYWIFNIPKDIDINTIKAEEGSISTPQSKYGQGCVKVTKCNKNLAIKNVKGYFSISDFKIKIDNNSESFLFYAEKGKEYTRSCKVNLDRNRIGKIDTLDVTQEMTVLNGQKINSKKFICDDSGIYIWFVNSTLNDSIKESFQIEESSTESSFEQHEEQSYIMPVQQEMLEGDYFDYDNEEEVHVWGKKILTGDEGWRMPSSNDTNAVFTNLSNTDFCDFKSDTDVQYCNYFKYKGIAQGFAVALNKGVGIYSFYSVNKYEYFVAPKAIASSVNEWKAYLKSQYDAGTPVVVYYQLATPKRLKFTDEQKAVAKELNNARTYKNVTNITTDSKAILSLDYVKDQETQNQKMQNEIDEIKQLLSTTQTSALLLDNMQTDIESEVK
nr:MAG TPA: hypothetical protein [Caudoviricetes sp.]